MTQFTNTKIETGAALLGAGIGAIGAVLVEPFILMIGAGVALTATIMRISDREKEKRPEVKSANHRHAAML